MTVDNFQGKQNVNVVTGFDVPKKGAQDYIGRMNTLHHCVFSHILTVCPPECWLSGVPKEDGKELLQLVAQAPGPNKMKPPVLRLEVTPKVSSFPPSVFPLKNFPDDY